MTVGIIELIFQLKSACLSKEEMIQEKLQLSPAELRGILALSPGTAVPCYILSKKMSLSVSRCSRVVEKMVKSGFLKETKYEKDRRVMRLSLTPKGKKIRAKIQEMLGDCEQSIIRKMSKNEIEIFEGSLLKISEILISI
jgi:DNA-binding MarR family transcriptional regulator